MPPRAIVCYICGRQYMLHSFAIHEPQCRELFEKREALKPPKERRKCPPNPFGVASSSSKMTLNEMNTASQALWSETLVKCANCGRSFLPEKLHVHNRSCRADNPARRVEESVNRRPSEMVEYEAPGVIAGLLKCQFCGRRFSEEAHTRHSQTCQKLLKKRRKPFDSAKARRKGTELEAFYRAKITRYGNSSQSSATLNRTKRVSQDEGNRRREAPPNWKIQSMQFRAAIRAMRTASTSSSLSNHRNMRAAKGNQKSGFGISSLLLSAAAVSRGMATYQRTTSKGPYTKSGVTGNVYDTDYSDTRFSSSDLSEQRDVDFAAMSTIAPTYVQCPHCRRSYNPKAAERHIPKCKDIINKPKALLRKSHDAGAGLSGNDSRILLMSSPSPLLSSLRKTSAITITAALASSSTRPPQIDLATAASSFGGARSGDASRFPSIDQKYARTTSSSDVASVTTSRTSLATRSR